MVRMCGQCGDVGLYEPNSVPADGGGITGAGGGGAGAVTVLAVTTCTCVVA